MPKEKSSKTQSGATKKSFATSTKFGKRGYLWNKGDKTSSSPLTGAGLIVIIAVASGAGLFFWGAATGWKFGLALITPPPTTGFSVGVWDGVSFEKLNNGDFKYVLYGTNNLGNWPSFNEIENGDSLDSIASGDLTGYTYYVMKYDGIVEIDDPKNSDNKMDVTYYVRWSQIFVDTGNVLYTYREPSATGIIAITSEDFVPVDLVAGVAAPKNITIIVATNSTETLAAWVLGHDYQAEADVQPNIVITFDGAVTNPDFSVSGTTKTTYSSTALRFSFDTINVSPQTLTGSWGISTGRKIIAIDLYYGSTLLASV